MGGRIIYEKTCSANNRPTNIAPACVHRSSGLSVTVARPVNESFGSNCFDQMTTLRKPKIYEILFSLIVLGILTSCSSSKHPSDQVLIENWRTHKNDFENLLQMFLTDKKLGRVAPGFTRPENPSEIGVNAARLSEYRNYFTKLDLTAGIEGYDEKNIIWFHASTQGLAVTGSGKGYAYTKNKPELLVDDLDKYWSKDGRSFTAFKPIEGNWYLYFDYED